MSSLFKTLALALAVSLPLAAHAHHTPDHDAQEHHGHAHHDHGQAEFPDPASVQAPQGVSVKGCWIRALPNRLPAAAYFQIANDSAHDAVLIGAQANGFGKVMLHVSETRGGMATMAHVDDVTVPAGESFQFAAGGHHVMLEQPTVELEIGTKRPLVLWFEGPRALTVECDVKPPSALQ